MAISVAKNKFKYLLGHVLAIIFPARRQYFEENLNSPYWGKHLSTSRWSRVVDSLIRYYLAHSDKKSGGDKLEGLHKDFWSKKIDPDWYQTSSSRFEESGLLALKPKLEQLFEKIEGRPITAVCEIGTGDGKLIAYLRDHLPGPKRFIGIDLFADRIAVNNQLYPEIEFYAGDAGSWIEQNSADGTLFVTNGGVLEYFSQQSLEKLLEFLAGSQAASMMAIFHEPVLDGHDLSSQMESKLTSAGEYTFSHNHQYLFEKSGFRVLYCADDREAGYRGVTLIAGVS